MATFLKTLKSEQLRYRLSYKKKLDGIQNGSLHGFLFVDIETAEHLKEKLVDFPPIIKNTDISRADIFTYMEKIAEAYCY